MYKILISTIVIVLGCDSARNGKSELANKEENQMITQFEGGTQTFIKHTFPDSLNSGDTLRAEIYSENEDWKIIEAYSYCRIGSDGIFRVNKRTTQECKQLFVEDNRVKIEFITMGDRNKKFDLLTLVLQDKNEVKKATELQLTYYLDSLQGS